jgi:hypothetical protein
MCVYISQYHTACWCKVPIVTETNRCEKARKNGFDCPMTEDTVCLDGVAPGGVCDFCGEFRLEMEQERLEEENERLTEEREARTRTEARGGRGEARGKARENKESGKAKKWTWRRWFGKLKSKEEVKDVGDDLYGRLRSVRLGPPQPPKPSTW